MKHIARKAIDTLPGASIDLWDSTEGRAIMQHILNEFLRVTKMVNSTPVIMFMPRTRDWKDGRIAPGYWKFKEDVVKREYGTLTVIDIYEAEFDEAVTLGRKAIFLSPKHVPNIALYAVALGRAGEYQEALHQIKKAIRLSPIYPAP